MWTSSELTITIMCVSIPVLRPLWTRVLGGTSVSDRYYKHSEASSGIMTGGRGRKSRGADNSFAMNTLPAPEFREQANTTMVGAKRPHSSTGSEESILGDNNIHKTREFTVSYETRKDMDP